MAARGRRVRADPQLGLRAARRDPPRSWRFARRVVPRRPSRIEQPKRKEKSGVLFAGGSRDSLYPRRALLPQWDRELLASGATMRPIWERATSTPSLRAGRLEYYREGAAGTVSVRRLTGTLSLAIDGKVDASNAGDMLTQRLLGLLPVLLHGHAQDICIIGLGRGVTVGAALTPGGASHLDVVEISRSGRASHYFDRERGGAVAAGVRLIVGAADHRCDPRRYDVIVSEPSNPWWRVASRCLPRFFGRRARGETDCSANGPTPHRRRRPELNRPDCPVFPRGRWLVGDGDLLLIGTNGGRVSRRGSADWRQAGAGPFVGVGGLGIDDDSAPVRLLSLYAGGPVELARYVERRSSDRRQPALSARPAWRTAGSRIATPRRSRRSAVASGSPGSSARRRRRLRRGAMRG
jgi:hypothetical protein